MIAEQPNKKVGSFKEGIRICQGHFADQPNFLIPTEANSSM